MRGLLIFCYIATFVLFPNITNAQEEQNLSISATPAVLDIALQKSRTYDETVAVSNTGLSTIPVSITAGSLFVDEQISYEEKSRYDASSWIKISENAVILEPDQSKEISFQIVVPDNASPGGHYATINIQALSLETEQATVTPELSVTVLLTVAGNIKESLMIEPTNVFPFYGTVGAMHISNIKITNSGNVHQIVAPELVFTHSGREELVRRLSPQLVLPGVTREFNEPWKLPENHKGFRAFLRINYGDSRQEEYVSEDELTIISYSPLWILSVGALTWTGVYLAHHRKYIRLALRALRHG